MAYRRRGYRPRRRVSYRRARTMSRYRPRRRSFKPRRRVFMVGQRF